MQVIVWHKDKECKAMLVVSCKFKGNGYICVIGEVGDYYDIKEIIAFDVCPVSSGHELTYLFWKWHIHLKR